MTYYVILQKLLRFVLFCFFCHIFIHKTMYTHPNQLHIFTYDKLCNHVIIHLIWSCFFGEDTISLPNIWLQNDKTKYKIDIISEFWSTSSNSYVLLMQEWLEVFMYFVFILDSSFQIHIKYFNTLYSIFSCISGQLEPLSPLLLFHVVHVMFLFLSFHLSIAVH